MQIDVYIAETAEITPIVVPEITEKTGEMTNSELLKGKQAQNVNISSTITGNFSEVHISYTPNQRQQAGFSSNGLAAQLVVLYDVKRDQSAGQIEV